MYRKKNVPLLFALQSLSGKHLLRDRKSPYLETVSIKAVYQENAFMPQIDDHFEASNLENTGRQKVEIFN